ncbi:MAG: metal-dependent transcriptional regulator [Thermoplasmata archaeon]|nr:metal-dependent transcriptional regulator [Thermoplasmata archaeon]
MVNNKLTREQEDYIIKIFEFEESFGITKLTDLSKILNYSTGAINDEIKRFEKMGIVVRIPYKGIMLSEYGKKIAEDVTRKHRIAEAFLYYVLNVPWEKCHLLSSDMEHAVNGQLEKYILKKLKNLKQCPHGNPFQITNTKDEKKLLEAELNVSYIINRITFEESDILIKYKTFGILPGEKIKILEKNEFGALVNTKKGKFILDNDDLLIIRVKE